MLEPAACIILMIPGRGSIITPTLHIFPSFRRAANALLYAGRLKLAATWPDQIDHIDASHQAEAMVYRRRRCPWIANNRNFHLQGIVILAATVRNDKLYFRNTL